MAIDDIKTKQKGGKTGYQDVYYQCCTLLFQNALNLKDFAAARYIYNICLGNKHFLDHITYGFFQQYIKLNDIDICKFIFSEFPIQAYSKGETLQNIIEGNSIEEKYFRALDIAKRYPELNKHVIGTTLKNNFSEGQINDYIWMRRIVEQEFVIDEDVLKTLILAHEGKFDEAYSLVITNDKLINKILCNVDYVKNLCICGCDKILKLLIDRGLNVSILDNQKKSLLVSSATYNQAEVVRTLIEAGADINSADSFKRSALMNAVLNGSSEAAQILIENGANTKTNNLTNLLILACSKGLTKIVEMLIERNEQINSKGQNGETALMVACANGYFHLTKMLIDNGAVIDVKDRLGKTPLGAACGSGHLDIVKMLIEKGAYLTFNGKSALKEACSNGHVEILKFLIELGVNVYEEGAAALTAAVAEERCEIVEILMNEGVKFNYGVTGNLPLVTAVTKGNVEIVRILIDGGMNINAKDAKGFTPLMHVGKKNFAEIIKMFIEHDVEYIDQSVLKKAVTMYDIESVKLIAERVKVIEPEVLNLAIQCDKIDIVRILIDNGADVNNYRPYDSQLLQAVICGNIKIVELLIEKGAKINLQCYKGSILSEAVRNNRFDIAQTLIRSGADVNLGGKDCPLAIACKNSMNDFIDLLLSNGVDFDICYDKRDYSTALIDSILQKNFQAVKLLVNKGAKISERAFSVALRNSNPEIIKFLVEKGASLNSNKMNDIDNLIIEGNLSVIRLLIECGIDVEEHSILVKLINNMPKKYSQIYQDKVIELIKLIIQKGIDINKVYDKYLSALSQAVLKRNLNLVKLLLENGAKVNMGRQVYTKELNPTSLALNNGAVDILMLLIENGNVYCLHNDGKSFLHYAAKINSLRLTDFLLKKGLDPNQCDNKNRTPLIVACSQERQDSSELVKMLIENGADIKKMDAEGHDAFYRALNTGNEKAVKLLIESGADIKEVVKGPFLNSLFFRACSSGYYEIVKLFLENIDNPGDYICEDDIMKASMFNRKKVVEILAITINKQNLALRSLLNRSTSDNLFTIKHIIQERRRQGRWQDGMKLDLYTSLDNDVICLLIENGCRISYNGNAKKDSYRRFSFMGEIDFLNNADLLTPANKKGCSIEKRNPNFANPSKFSVQTLQIRQNETRPKAQAKKPNSQADWGLKPKLHITNKFLDLI